jgi:hypothetical protein
MKIRERNSFHWRSRNEKVEEKRRMEGIPWANS